MKNMKVSVKLIFSFAVVIVLAILIGVVGIIGMYQMNVADDGLYNGNYLPTVLAGNISQHIVSQRVIIRNFVIFDLELEPEDFKSAENALTTSRKELDTLMAEYDPTIVNPEDRSTFDQFVQTYKNEWSPAVDRILELGLANEFELSKQAMNDAAGAAERLDELTSKLQDINLSDGKATVDGNTALFQRMTFISIGVIVFVIIVSMAFALYISSIISKPLMALTAFMEKAGSTGDISLGQEDYAIITEMSKYKDELGRCIASTTSFINRLTLVGQELEVVASGDLTVNHELLSDRDTMGLSLRKMVDNLNQMFAEINSSTAQVATGAKQIADGAQSLAQGSTEQAAAVQQLSSSISEVASSTKENATMAQKASQLAETIKGNAEKGSMQMDTMMEAVREINQASQSINKVIKVIDDIAFQTNILALNAAVEAARAGQHGKGFAVVAEEVRNLAGKSAEAAKDTGGLIANSMEKAELGARIAEETAASLSEIVSGINESTEIVSEIAKSSEDQSQAIDQINRGIDQVAQVVQQNSATAEESAAASEEMSGQSDMLESLIAQFKLKEQNNRFAALGGRSKQQGSHSLPTPKHSDVQQYSNSGDYGKY